MPSFGGFPREAGTFFRQLAKNNNRDWFLPRKEQFEEKVRGPMAELVEAINAELARWAPAFVTEPKKAIYRIYRDTRFSADKTPYKTQIAASFVHRALQKHAGAGFYTAFSHRGVDVAGGVYMPGPEELLAIRGLIAREHEKLQKLVSGKLLQKLAGGLHGDELARVPKGFPKDHPAEAVLRKKQWYFYVTLDADLAFTPKLPGEVVKRFKAIHPFVEFVNAPLLSRRKEETARAMWG